MKRASITGIAGQDGSYLTEFLLAMGYEADGTISRSSTVVTDRIDRRYRDPNVPAARVFLHVTRMVQHDLELARQERTLREAGHAVAPRRIAHS